MDVILKKIVFRFDQNELRPSKVIKLRKVIADTYDRVDKLHETHPWIQAENKTTVYSVLNTT